jgi:hypothetical protein
MVIAMAIMRVMQVIADEIVDVVSVGHGFMTAARPVDVIRSMSATMMVGRAARGIVGADFQHVLIHMIAVHMMQMAIVQIVDMIAVSHSRMAAARAVNVGVAVMMRLIAGGHWGGAPFNSFRQWCSSAWSFADRPPDLASNAPGHPATCWTCPLCIGSLTPTSSTWFIFGRETIASSSQLSVSS